MSRNTAIVCIYTLFLLFLLAVFYIKKSMSTAQTLGHAAFHPDKRGESFEERAKKTMSDRREVFSHLATVGKLEAKLQQQHAALLVARDALEALRKSAMNYMQDCPADPDETYKFRDDGFALEEAIQKSELALARVREAVG